MGMDTCVCKGRLYRALPMPSHTQEDASASINSYPKVVCHSVHHQCLHPVYSPPQHHRDAELLKGKFVWYQEALCHQGAIDPGEEAVLANVDIRLLKEAKTMQSCKNRRHQ